MLRACLRLAAQRETKEGENDKLYEVSAVGMDTCTENLYLMLSTSSIIFQVMAYKYMGIFSHCVPVLTFANHASLSIHVSTAYIHVGMHTVC